MEKVERRLVEFDGVDVFGLSEAALRKWGEYANSVEGLLKEARGLIDEGRAFFTDQNMALFQYLRITPQALAEYRRQRWENKAGKWRTPST